MVANGADLISNAKYLNFFVDVVEQQFSGTLMMQIKKLWALLALLLFQILIMADL